jgi:hypothetical protein
VGESAKDVAAVGAGDFVLDDGWSVRGGREAGGWKMFVQQASPPGESVILGKNSSIEDETERMRTLLPGCCKGFEPAMQFLLGWGLVLF